jgi:hypothetical protein
LKGDVRVYRDRQQANLSFHSHKPISALETTKGVFGVLFYENGSNGAQIKMKQLERHNDTVTVGKGLRYWKWTWSTSVMELGECDIKDFVVLLQKEAQEKKGNTLSSQKNGLRQCRITMTIQALGLTRSQRWRNSLILPIHGECLRMCR